MQNLNFTILAIIAVIGLLGLAVAEIISVQLQVEAAKSITGQCASSIKNASSSLCHTLQ